jgi:hypothetical protein
MHHRRPTKQSTRPVGGYRARDPSALNYGLSRTRVHIPYTFRTFPLILRVNDISRNDMRTSI